MVYVLLTYMHSKAGGEWRPVAVVDEAHRHVAEQWAKESDSKNDWIPLEMNDLSMTETADIRTTFRPKPPVPEDKQQAETVRKLREANERLIKLVETLMGKKQAPQTVSASRKNPLLRPK